MIIYEGPSQAGGDDIVVIVTGFKSKSSNRKTGKMIQTWILLKDTHPSEALKTGADQSICGDCIHRPRFDEASGKTRRTCYVNIMGPNQIWKTYRAGKYERVDPEVAGDLLSGLPIRLGSYGDPAMVPIDVWRSLIKNASKTTGYTHQWRTMSSEYSEFCMASCDTADDVEDAKSLGYRWFRVLTEDEELIDNEISCPASEEAGKLTTCEKCGLCGGASERFSSRVQGIGIIAHGNSKKFYKPVSLTVSVGKIPD